MRPTDEHQSPSTRPNFMAASRRPAGPSDNILARLERGGERARRRWSRAAMLASVGVVALTTGFIWILSGLAQDNLQVHPAREVIVTATPPQAAPSAEPASAPRPEVRAPDAEELLVEPTLTPPPLLAEVETPPAAPLAVKPPRAPMKTTALTGAPRLAASKARPAIPKAAPPSHQAAEPGIDGDVALLSAILIAAPRHSAERARSEAACNDDKKCQQSIVPSLLKTTD